MLALWLVGVLVLEAPPVPRSDVPPALQHCADLYYNFELESAAACTRKAWRESPSSMEAAYWHSKTLWVLQLDRQIDVNQDLMSLVLDKEPTKKRIDAALKEEFLTVIKSGLDAASGGTSAEHRYYYGAIRGNETAWDLLLEGSKLSALRGIKQTMTAMNEALRLNPSNHEPYALLGMGNYLLGTNPWYLRMFAYLYGANGDRVLGVEQLQKASNAGSQDAAFLYKGVLVREGRLKEGISALSALLVRYPRNVFFMLERADLLARTGDKTAAIQQYGMAATLISRTPSLQKRFGPGFIDKKLAAVRMP